MQNHRFPQAKINFWQYSFIKQTGADKREVIAVWRAPRATPYRFYLPKTQKPKWEKEKCTSSSYPVSIVARFHALHLRGVGDQPSINRAVITASTAGGAGLFVRALIRPYWTKTAGHSLRLTNDMTTAPRPLTPAIHMRLRSG